MEKVDCAVIGAGVVGLAVASRLAEAGREVIVLEKNFTIGAETSSRNSEVVHAGIYYKKESLKAVTCVRGRSLLYAFCDQYGVPYNKCGKVIVGANTAQLNTIKGYADNARSNGVDDLIWLNKDEINRLEPDVISVGGILSPSTGIVDSHAFMLQLQANLESNGAVIALGTEVLSLRTRGNTIVTNGFNLSANWIINCAGLNAPVLSKDIEGTPNAKFAKGHYFSYSGAHTFSRLIYPVAEEGGLGVHVTLDMVGSVRFGPDVQWIDDIDYSFQAGLKPRFEAAIRRYFPKLDCDKLQPSYTGIRPKIAYENQIYSDFIVRSEIDHGFKGRIDLFGIESPGLTASLALADDIVHLVESSLG